MGNRSTSTRRQWLTVCSGATAGAATLAGCLGSDDDPSDSENGSSENGDDGNGEEADENGGGAGSASSGGSWPMERFSASNQMVTDDWSGPDGPLEGRWTVETGEDEKVSGPVVNNGLVYVAVEGAKLYAIDVQNGDIEWEFQGEKSDEIFSPEYLPTTPAVTDDAVYFLTDTLKAIDPETGDELWAVELNSREPGDIRVNKNFVFVHNDGGLYGIDIGKESVIWEDDANSIQDIAVGDDETFYVIRRTNNDNDYEVIAFDVENDEVLWTYSPSGNVAAGFGLIVREGTVYIHELDNVLAIDSETGDARKLAEYDQTEETYPTGGTAPTIANGTIYSSATYGYPAVYAAEIETGEEPDTWDSDELKNGPTGLQPFVSNDTLYVWRGFGYVDLNLIDPETGEKYWSFDVREHQDMIRGMIEGYAILEDSIIYTIDGNYSVIGALETA